MKECMALPTWVLTLVCVGGVWAVSQSTATWRVAMGLVLTADGQGLGKSGAGWGMAARLRRRRRWIRD